jgi:hypothetical protein
MLLYDNYSKGGHMLQPLAEEIFVLILDVPKKRGVLSCSHLSTSTKMGKNQQKPGSYDMGY